MGPMGPKGDPASFDVLVVDVPQKAWVYSDLFDNNYFSATVKMPEITEDVFDEGVIMVYRTYDFDGKNPSQVALPYVRLNEEITATDEFFYTETVDYEYGIGTMNFYYTVSDFIYELEPAFVPDAMQFRVVILY